MDTVLLAQRHKETWPVKIPSACEITGSCAIQATKRGEYAAALNCSITKVNEKTTLVRAIMPEAIAESIAVADAMLIAETSPGRTRPSSRGTVSPAASAAPAYNAGIPQALS